jgi:hypothetical protein
MHSSARRAIFAMPLFLAAACARKPPAAKQASQAADSDSATPMTEMAQATHDMSGHHMGMGLHMKMTELRPSNASDKDRADEIVARLRPAIDRYRDYRAAEADGYRIFLPRVSQKMYHFTNWSYGYEAAFRFDPTRPTSLLYEETSDGYRLIGAMYTARKNATEEELNQRVPLSVAQWHAHVNICMAPVGRAREMLSTDARFGLRGSIATPAACDDAGGRWVPQVFGWMVHVYPFERDPGQFWSIERQMTD